MKTLLEPQTEAILPGLLAQIEKRDQQITALGQRLEHSHAQVRLLEQMLKSAHVDAGKPPAHPVRLQVFWLSAEAPTETFSEARSRVEEIAPNGAMRDYIIELPASLGPTIRIDPGSGPAFWDFEYFGLHPINSEEAIAARPATLCVGATGFAGLSINDGALLLALEENNYSLFATSVDPQILWKLPAGLPDAPLALKIRCRARNCADGLAQSILLNLNKIQDANDLHIRGELAIIRREIGVLSAKMEKPVVPPVVVKPRPSFFRRLLGLFSSA